MPAKVNLKLPALIWNKTDTLRLARDTLAMIKLRTSRGLDADGQPFKEYSRKKIYIPIGKGTGARLKPKGGQLTASGKSMKFEGGYKEYKELSRKRGNLNEHSDDSAEVDLVLSGALMNNLVILNAQDNKFTIGLTTHVQYYGYAVNAKRTFLGLSEQDVDILVATVQEIIFNHIRGKR